MDIRLSKLVVQCSDTTCICSEWFLSVIVHRCFSLPEADMKQNAFQDMVQLLSLGLSRIMLSEGIKRKAIQRNLYA